MASTPFSRIISKAALALAEAGEEVASPGSLPNLPAVADVLQDRVERGQGVTQLRHHDGELAAMMKRV